MFEYASIEDAASKLGRVSVPVTAAPMLRELRDLLLRLAALAGPSLGVSGSGPGVGSGPDEAGLLDHLSALEELKGAAAAAQARLTATLIRARNEREAERGIRVDRRCQGLAAEIALARRTSPHRGARDLGMAKALVHEMPHTLAALARGEISEWRATLLVRETAVLTREHRARVDEEIAGRLAGLGDRTAAAEARMIGYRLDPGSALRRTRGANSDRFVSLRPAPDTMSYLTGFLPVAQAVACKAALTRHADSLRARGDTRGRGQIMADTLVERVTGQATPARGTVEIELVMTDAALLAGADTPAQVVDYGPVPASVARQIVRDADKAWVRRLYTRSGDGGLVAMDSRRRIFDGALRRFLVLRDQVCRTPWCDAPVRHVDHIVPATSGGSTSADNAQGICETCNYAKQAPGWRSTPLAGRQSRVQVTTPSGHRYLSTAADPPAAHSPLRALAASYAGIPSPLEEQLRHLGAA